MYPKILLLMLSFSSLNGYAQTAKKQVKDWHLLDYKKDGYRGISLNQAYALLKGKKSTTVIVAVIDSGIDTLQEDIQPVFWKNPGEIPNNKIDDDKNGLVDDIHGWNYLGAPNGENLAISVPDTYRTYHRFKNEFEYKKIKEIAADRKYVYNEWKRAEKIITTNASKANKEINAIRENFKIVTETNTHLQRMLKKESFTNKDITALPGNKKDSTTYSKNIWLNIFGDNDFTNLDFIKDFENYKKTLEENIQYATTTPVDYRGQLLQDDSYAITKKFYGNTNLQSHSGYHGTSVSGIIGAVRNNGKGIDGIADNVRIMMIRAILGKDEYDKDVAVAIRYAVDHGAKVINMSFGKSISPDKKWVDDAIRYAQEKDVVLVHASGNDAQDIDVDFNYPNAFYLDGKPIPNFINVGASGDYSTGNLVAPFSNYGKKMVDIMAPGMEIHCSIANNGTQVASGTSMASPVVAGIAALLRSYFPKLTAPQIVQILKNSGTAIPEKVIKPGTKDTMINFKELCATGKIANAEQAIKLALTFK